MLDIRYHIASLTAVFLALGFGILIGSSIAAPAAIRQMSAQIKKQNNSLDEAVQLNEQDHAYLKQNEDAIGALVPRLVENQLAGKRVAIVQTGDYPEAARDAATAIEQAGGQVSSTTVLTSHFDMLSDDDRQGLAKALGLTSDDDSALLRPLNLALRQGTTAHPSLQSDLATLVQAGVLESSGDYTTPVTMVVLAGGSLSAPDPEADGGQPTHDETLISLLHAPDGDQKGAIVVGCEPRDAVQSSVPVYLRTGIASVDCIDEPLGALDLPFALNGEVSAYGIKPTSDRLIPQSLEAPEQAPA